MGPETLRGRHHPKRFSLGLHPVSLGKTKEMGWNRQHNVKKRSNKTASSSNAKSPRAGMEPRPYEGVGGAWWGWRRTKERVVGDADPYGSLRNGPRATGFSGCRTRLGKW